MKMRNIYRAVLALALSFSLTVPVFAAEGENAAAPEEQPPIQTPGTPDEADPEPPAWLLPPENPNVPEDPGGAAQPETPPETPETPEAPTDPEAPSVPEAPEAPENPPAAETPETPDSPVTPPAEDPALPPSWILPPEQLPVQPPEQVPPVEAPIQTPQAEVPIINVVVPNIGTAIINPYGLPVTVDGQETTEQIAGSTMLLENYSNVAVDVSVNAVGNALGGVVFAAQPPAEGSLQKELFLYAEFQATEALGLTVPWQGFFSDAQNQLLVTPYGSAKDGLMRLEAVGTAYSWGAARLFGSAAAYPAQPWETGDGFQVSLSFTFTPVVSEAAGIDASGDTDFDAPPALPPEQAVPSAPAVPDEPASVPEPQPDIENAVDALFPAPAAPAEDGVQGEVNGDIQRGQPT